MKKRLARLISSACWRLFWHKQAGVIQVYFDNVLSFGRSYMNSKPLIILVLCSITVFSTVFGQYYDEWKDYTVFQVGAEHPHASFMSYLTKEEALTYSYLPFPVINC